MGLILDRVLTATLVLIAGAMVAVFIRREFRPSAAVASAEPAFVSEWREVAAAGVRVGSTDAPVTIVEFMDFECPYCRIADTVLSSVIRTYGSSVAVVFVHFPLGNHRFAIPAARAAECAFVQSRFDEMRTVLYAKQDSFGIKTWNSYARDSGVRDTARFARCIQETGEMARVSEGRRLGEAIGVRGTPTILVNGWRYPRPPDHRQLTQVVSDALAGKDVGEAVKRSLSN